MFAFIKSLLKKQSRPSASSHCLATGKLKSKVKKQMAEA